MSNTWRNRIVGHGKESPDQLLANPLNWRVHPEHQQEALDGVLSEVGWVQEVIVNRRTGHLIDGHLRVALAMRRGEPMIPVLYVDLSEEEERLILATLDPLAAMAIADAGKLDELLQEVSTTDAAIMEMLSALAADAGLYFGDDEDEPPEDPGPQVDRAEELREKWRTDTGQLWVIPSMTADGEHRIVCGDCTDPQVVERVMGGDRIDAVITDPPYGVNVHYPGWRDTPENLGRLITTVHPVLLKMTNGPVVWFGAASRIVDDILAFREKPQRVLIWFVRFSLAKTAAHGMFYRWRPIYCWQLPSHHDDGPDRDVIDEMTEGHNDWDHSGTKPVSVMTKLVGLCVRGGTVLDPFLGSGTTLVSCEHIGRLGCGIEITPKYVAVALQRLADMGLEPRLVDG